MSPGIVVFKEPNIPPMDGDIDFFDESHFFNFGHAPALGDGALNNCTPGEMVQAMADIHGRDSGGPEW